MAAKDLKKDVDEVKDKLEHLVVDGRDELADYASKTLRTIQQNLVAATDEALGHVFDAFEDSLDRGRQLCSKFIVELGGTIGTTFKGLEARPVIPVLGAFLIGGVLGAAVTAQFGKRESRYAMMSDDS